MQQPDPSGHVVQLPRDGTTVAAGAVHTELLNAMEQGGAVIIDGSLVHTIGQAVLQLLLATRRQAIAAGTAYNVVNASPALVDQARRYCLAEAIGLHEKALPQ